MASATEAELGRLFDNCQKAMSMRTTLSEMCMDVKDFYLSNQMEKDKYIMIQLSIIPQEFVEKYNLTEKSHNGYTRR